MLGQDLPQQRQRYGMTLTPGGDGPLTILLVEDEPLIALTIVDILEEFGHTVLEAGSAAEAARIFASRSDIALLITDIGLPDMPGDGLARQLRDERPGLPVLFATGRAADGSVGDGAIEQPFERLSKPFLMHELQAAIARLVAKAG
jgi:CheY-like chemotaxis protein